MELGFLIDQRKCIGCHACTVACKAENEVPVGSFRTWVKYVEKGVFPDVRRGFTVLRCNHCDAAPCVTICPVKALGKRPDRIVDLDRDRCIGCRACMQACPYDALYLNEDSGVAEKCHFCAHRTELGLEPACVVVCPERAIVAGDLADPASPISTMVRELPTSRRKVEKGTAPRVWYVDAEPEGLVGGAAEPATWLWADRMRPPPEAAGPVTPGEAMTVLNADHREEWGWHVWAYVATKNVAAGVLLLAPLLAALGAAPAVAASAWPEVVSLLFLGITAFLLVHDLGRPERFLRIVFTPNTRSWLVKGTWVLMAFGAAAAGSAAARWLGAPRIGDLFRYAAVPLAVLTAGYSAWLFAQCRGRELWGEEGLFTHLAARAGMFGAGFAALLPAAETATGGAARVFLVFAAANGAWILLNRSRPPHGREGREAHRILWADGTPTAAALLLFTAAAFALPEAAGLDAAATTGLGVATALVAELLYERAWIRAGQAVPLS